jgi:hypothetical protein
MPTAPTQPSRDPDDDSDDEHGSHPSGWGLDRGHPGGGGVKEESAGNLFTTEPGPHPDPGRSDDLSSADDPGVSYHSGADLPEGSDPGVSDGSTFDQWAGPDDFGQSEDPPPDGEPPGSDNELENQEDQFGGDPSADSFGSDDSGWPSDYPPDA